MKKIMFVCHGNICRSPMAEFLMKYLLKKKNLEKDFYVCSSATSTEELGNPVHYGTQKVLKRFDIDCSKKRAVQLSKSDYEKYHLFIGMDDKNVRNMLRIFGSDNQNKVKLLLDYTSNPRSVADPYFTRNFEETFLDINEGINALIDYLILN